jgi:hypothetical protein
MCPNSNPRPVTGTFDLVSSSSSGSKYKEFEVKNLYFEWEVGTMLRRVQTYASGSGIYKMDQNNQQMKLSLSINGSTAVLFDSGLVSRLHSPAIAVSLSMSNFTCRDTNFEIAANPDK